MDRCAEVVRVQFPPERRVLAVSDIHGNLPFLKGLLQKVHFTTDDILVIIGDLIEKGPDSLATLHYIMELCRTHTVYVINGNCDNLVSEFAWNEGLPDKFYHFYLGIWKEHSMIVQMARNLGYTEGPPYDLEAMRALLRENYQEEQQWLRSLPTILLSDDYIFVHGGVPREDHLETLSSWHCMKDDDFLSQRHHFRRWCIVGHWPVTLYNTDIASAAPLLDHECHIASIDGGCVLKLDGQLNGLILPERPDGEFSWAAYDGLPVMEALDAQSPSLKSINIRWGHNVVELLEKGSELSRCRHVETGWELDILTEYLYDDRGLLRCEDSTDYRLPVQPGDRISIVRKIKNGYLAKKDGVTGWYFGRCREEQ